MGIIKFVLMIVGVLFLLGRCNLVQAAGQTWTWDAVPASEQATGYRLYCGNNNGPKGTYNATPVFEVPATLLSKTSTLAPGKYYCALKAYKTSSITATNPKGEGAYSNEVFTDIPVPPVIVPPPSAPPNLRYILDLVWDKTQQKYVATLTPRKAPQ